MRNGHLVRTPKWWPCWRYSPLRAHTLEFCQKSAFGKYLLAYSERLWEILPFIPYMFIYTGDIYSWFFYFMFLLNWLLPTTCYDTYLYIFFTFWILRFYPSVSAFCLLKCCINIIVFFVIYRSFDFSDCWTNHISKRKFNMIKICLIIPKESSSNSDQKIKT